MLILLILDPRALKQLSDILSGSLTLLDDDQRHSSAVYVAKDDIHYRP